MPNGHFFLFSLSQYYDDDFSTKLMFLPHSLVKDLVLWGAS